MAALQVLLELVLVGVDHADIVAINAELTSLGVICQAVVHGRRGVANLFFLHRGGVVREARNGKEVEMEEA